MSDLSQTKIRKWKKNQGGVSIVFFPIILLSFIFIYLDNNFTQNEFSDLVEYFNNLYINRSIVFIFVLLFWNFLKNLVSGYLLLVIVYAFNILLVVSDNMNIKNMMSNYQNYSETKFFQLLKIKEICNNVFLILWIAILILNLKSWYTLYVNSRETILDENEENIAKVD